MEKQGFKSMMDNTTSLKILSRMEQTLSWSTNHTTKKVTTNKIPFDKNKT